ncbi:MAG: tetratricopeptide repeat protein [candidate division NC10 bacterium]|jgi:regulator of sirC expression with transglutaminase-like and TPR domain|nr:tetratricopeptide repeat protein [candidate division NC10 bacterium]
MVGMQGERAGEIQWIRSRFAEMVARAEEQIDLAETALLIAAEDYPHLDIGGYLGRIGRMAERIKERVSLELEPVKLIEELNRYLFDEEGFRGNSEDYYDPKNSFLNEVIDRRKGIPITLSMLYMEIAWRLDLPLVGVGFPGHFIVKYPNEEQEILIDPFHRGTLLSEDDCQHTLDRIYGEKIVFNRELLIPIPKRLILSRILNNLKGIYLHRKDFPRALEVVHRLLLIHPDSPTELRDRGLIYGKMKKISHAVADLRRYLEAVEEAEDREAITEHLRHLQMRQVSQN